MTATEKPIQLMDVVEKLGHAEVLYKKCYAAELCRKMMQLHKEVVAEFCAGCKINHPSQLRHACCGFEEYFHFLPSCHSHVFLHRAADLLEDKLLNMTFAKALIAEKVPLEYGEQLCEEYKRGAEGAWFGQVYQLIVDAEIDDHSCVYPDIVLPVCFGNPTVAVPDAPTAPEKESSKAAMATEGLAQKKKKNEGQGPGGPAKVEEEEAVLDDDEPKIVMDADDEDEEETVKEK